MRPLVPLSPDARTLLELGAEVRPPTAEQNARMARTLAPLLAASLPAPPEGDSGALLPEPIPAPRALSGAGRRLLGHGAAQLLVAAGAVAATTIASFCLGRISAHVDEPPPVAGVTAAASLAALQPPSPAPQTVALVPEETALELAPTSAQFSTRNLSTRDLSTRKEAEHPPAAAAAQPPAVHGARSGGLAADIERLAHANAALRQAQPGQALQLLERPVVRELREQAAALQAIAACDAGVARPSRNVSALLERWPGSPYEARVRAACGP